ncbi:hypothetical protein [Nonomuraea sp. NPDC046570]|uniref:hypothetical protein n=1 Tax=Nonomuraea sp. NPDC046570 TaxID=3155255 RepID=UPI00340079FA
MTTETITARRSRRETACTALAALFLLLSAAQIVLAAAGAFGLGWDGHGFANALAMFVVGVLLFIATLVAKGGWKRILAALLLLVVMDVQGRIGAYALETPVLGIFHGVGALVIIGLGGHLLHASRRR